MSRYSPVGILLTSALWLAAGCSQEPPRATTVSPSAAPIAASATEASSPAGAVGDDAEASLREIGKRATTAMAEFKQPQKLLYPPGFYRRGFAPNNTSVEVVAPSGDSTAPRGVVRITYQELFSVVHPTEEAAAVDEELYPRNPKAPRESMLDDRTNPPLSEMTLEIDYEARDGQWYRRDWRGKARLTRGADLLDVIGMP